jgi:glycosyltransferase involved in cell wall biosynthesis
LNVLFLARVEKEKGIYEAIEAFRLVQRKHLSICLTVAGDGSELKSVQEYVRTQRIEGITFLGWVRGSSKLEAFANADLYLFPTYREGMPNSMLEAMACGLPVVTRAVGGVRDFFEDGKMGFLTESKEPGVFAELLERLLLDPTRRHAMAHYNYLFAKQHFAASVVAWRLVNVYRKTMKTRDVDLRSV